MPEKNTITDIVNKHLDRSVSKGFNDYPGEIEVEMRGEQYNPDSEYNTWYHIDSKITDAEIEDFEKKLGYPLPADYKIFLKYKHFYELHIAEASFVKHPVNSWREQLDKFIFNGWPTEYHIEQGLIPFADWSDWGLLCFDTNRNPGNNDYPVILWDHDGPVEIQDKSANFVDLMVLLDQEDIEMHNF